MPLNLDYFYGNEAEQYSFYRIPKALFTDEHYKGVSVEAKVLYGLMLDRMSLSVRNGWLDGNGRVFIYFTLDDAMAQMNCGKDKMVKLFKALDENGGIGLIERRKQGQGRPTRIYVKNFTIPTVPSQSPPPEPEPDAVGPIPTGEEAQTSEKPKSAPQNGTETKTSDNPKPAFRDSTEVKASEKPKSAFRKTRTQDCGKTDPNNTDKNKTEINDTETDVSIPPPTPALYQKSDASRQTAMHRRMRMDERETYRELIEENIDYRELLRQNPFDDELLDGYVELMVDVCCSRRETIRINRDDIPTEVVKSHFLKLNSEHISYVMTSLKENTTKISNIKAYTLSALYNAPMLMSQYYFCLVSHDMAHGVLTFS